VSARPVRRLALAVAVALHVVAAPVVEAAAKDRRAPCESDGGARAARFGPDAHVQVEGAGDDGRRHPGHRFSPRRVADLVVVVKWTHVDTAHTQRLALIAPDGTVYRSTTALVSPEGAFARQATVETVVPVRGTWIVDYNLYGGWCAEVYIDGTAEPVARRSFLIAPR